MLTYQPNIIQTIAGTGEPGYSGDGGPATQALQREPFMCAFDRQGNLYVAEARNHCVRRIDKDTGVITTVAGAGASGYSGDGGPATQATFNEPYSLEIDGNGDIYIVDRLNAVVRKVDASTGVISTVAGHRGAGLQRRRRAGQPSPTAGTQRLLPRRTRRSADCGHPGPAHQAAGLGIGHHHDLCGQRREGARRRRRSRYRRQHPGRPRRVHGQQGNTYIAEREGNGVRKVHANGVMSTLAGDGERGYTGDGGPALTATWGAPKAIRCDPQDNIVVVDTENHAIRRIDASTGIVTTIAGRSFGWRRRRRQRYRRGNGPALTVAASTSRVTCTSPTATTTACES